MQGGGAHGNAGGADGAGGAVSHDREAYALAAGFSLGLINLGRGHSAAGSAHANGGMLAALKSLILGGAWGASHGCARLIVTLEMACSDCL